MGVSWDEGLPCANRDPSRVRSPLSLRLHIGPSGSRVPFFGGLCGSSVVIKRGAAAGVSGFTA